MIRHPRPVPRHGQRVSFPRPGDAEAQPGGVVVLVGLEAAGIGARRVALRGERRPVWLHPTR